MMTINVLKGKTKMHITPTQSKSVASHCIQFDSYELYKNIMNIVLRYCVFYIV